MSTDEMPTGRPLRDWFLNAPASDVVMAFVEDPSVLENVRSALREYAPGLPMAAVQVAVDASKRSTCRSKRGAVAFRDDRVISFGWNHKPDGSCDGSETCKRTCRLEAVHAEEMIAISTVDISGCDIVHAKTVNDALVPSGGPSCLECSKLMLAAGVRAVWLYHDSGWRRYLINEFHRLTLAHVRSTMP